MKMSLMWVYEHVQEGESLKDILKWVLIPLISHVSEKVTGVYCKCKGVHVPHFWTMTHLPMLGLSQLNGLEDQHSRIGSLAKSIMAYPLGQNLRKTNIEIIETNDNKPCQQWGALVSNEHI